MDIYSDARETWEENTAALKGGYDTRYTGEALMKMTDCSQARREQANREQAQRRTEMEKK